MKIKLNLCQEILDLYFRMTIVIDAYNIDHRKKLNISWEGCEL